jgi:hypothetical protein
VGWLSSRNQGAPQKVHRPSALMIVAILQLVEEPAGLLGRIGSAQLAATDAVNQPFSRRAQRSSCDHAVPLKTWLLWVAQAVLPVRFIGQSGRLSRRWAGHGVTCR